MISRRNIRIKVMQTLYTITSLENDADGIKPIAKRILDDKLEHVFDIFTASVLLCIRITQYAETDALKRSSRYLKTEDDENVNTKIAGNLFQQYMLVNKSFNERVKNSHIEKYINKDWVKKIYQQLVITDEYRTYINKDYQDFEEDKSIIQFIWYKLVLENAGLIDYFIDDLQGWEDNSELVNILMQNFFKSKSKIDFADLLAKDKRDYAQELLETVIDKEDFFLELITPRLNNWDKERVALIDMLLLKMGVCELLFFPTIPVKVTINEFIDIAKQYSTPQSGQFVNGVLDNILKDLIKENKIHKEEKKQ